MPRPTVFQRVRRSPALRRLKPPRDLLREVTGVEARLAELSASLDDRFAPRSEIERVDRLYEQLPGLAPASEVERLDLAFEQLSELQARLGDTAPASEVERLNRSFAEIAELRVWLRDLVLSERCVEIPWVLSHYRADRRVLEVGYAFAEDRYVEALGHLGIPQLVGLDLAPGRAELADTFQRVLGDVRADLFAPGSFDLVLCVSTIEHIGRDNSIYGVAAEDGSGDPDHQAIRAMAGWLADEGRLLLTVPFGRFEDHGWLINYDAPRLDALVEASGLAVTDSRYYEQRGGWVPCDRDEARNRGYRSLGAPHAGAVALLELTKSP